MTHRVIPVPLRNPLKVRVALSSLELRLRPYARSMETQSVEDINAVLRRFQAWTGSRNAVEQKAGVRELSYEEALESGRYRWKGADRARSGKAEDAQREPETALHKDGDLKHSAAKKAGAKENVAKRAAVAKSAAKRAFREVLVETVRRSEIVAPVKQTEIARQAAISVRFAPEERALIKARAAEAGISASAYVRQCALEVEQLRAQVRDAIAAMERGVGGPIQGSIAAPGFFARIARRLCARNAPSLALRA